MSEERELLPFLSLLEESKEKEAFKLFLELSLPKRKRSEEIGKRLGVSTRRARDLVRIAKKNLEMIKEDFKAKYGEGAVPEK